MYKLKNIKTEDIIKELLSRLGLGAKQEVSTETVVEEEDISTKVHKKYDSTRITRRQGKFVIKAYNNFIAYNEDRKIGTPRKTTMDLTAEINKALGLDKSVAVYAHIWHGKRDFSVLPLGKKIDIHL
jgi:hypothetical protein